MFEKLLKKAARLGVFSWGIVKICLLSAGILLGAYFSRFFMMFIPAVWAVAVITYIYLVYWFFIKKHDLQ